MFRFLFDIDTWQELKESLTKNKLRTVITMIGVWWGILLLIGLLGSAKGIENKFSVQFGDYATNSVFIWGQSTSIAFKGYQEGRFPRLKFSHLEKIKNQVRLGESSFYYLEMPEMHKLSEEFNMLVLQCPVTSLF